MSSSFEKSVKGATKLKLAPPKSKYIEHIIQGTYAGDAGVAEVFRTLQFRLRDSTWTIAFKALIVVHLMIREGQPDATLKYLSQDFRKVMTNNTYSDVQTQGRNIRAYSDYLIERARAYAKTRYDYVGGGQGRLKRLSIDKGLLRETETVQEQIQALLKCDLFGEEPENEITLMAYRLLVTDLLTLFQVMNEGTINILEKYFEMSRPDAERALRIYKAFAKQTEKVVGYLSVARYYEHSTRVEIPKIKHAPTGLAASLEEYLNDKDFDVNRRQYLAQQEAKRTGKPISSIQKEAGPSKPATSKPDFPEPSGAETNAGAPAQKGPAPDLIDLFGSIEQNQQPMAQNPAQLQSGAYSAQFVGNNQPTGFSGAQNGFAAQQPPQSTNPFAQFQSPPQAQIPPQTQSQQPQFQPQLQSQPTGAGFGGYTPQTQQEQQQTQFQPQSQQQGQMQSFPQQFPPTNSGPNLDFSQAQSSPFTHQQALQRQQTNPFRQSTMPQATGQPVNSPFNSPPPPQLPNQTGTNPFMSQSTGIQSNAQQFSSPTSNSPFQNAPPPFQSQQNQHPQGLTPQRTGTNPFARASPSNFSQTSQPSSVTTNATGSTNPFRQSTFVNQQTGQGWQSGQNGTMGGLEAAPTVPVFPRPGQPQQPQQSQTPWS
ncbi:MAG: hypothetical protein M1831_005412 [Alyxoria varia]|nr:MAG: hypothetical protein M1831_005412 [Alyxoria varia]